MLDQAEFMIQRLPGIMNLKPSASAGGDSTIGLVAPPEVLISSLQSRIDAAHAAQEGYWRQLQNRRSAESRQRDQVSELRKDVGHVREILKRLCHLAERDGLAELCKARRRGGRSALDPNDPITDSANDLEDPPPTEIVV